MTNPNSAVEEKIKEAMAQEQPTRRPMVACECEIYYLGKEWPKETIVTVDQPMPLPNGMMQFHLGTEMIIINPQQVRKMKIKALPPQEENRIIT